MNYLVSVLYAASLNAVEAENVWNENLSSLTLHHSLCYILFLFFHILISILISLELWIIVLTLALPISVSWKSEQVSKMHKPQTDTECRTILRNIYSTRSQAEDVLYVSAKGEASPKGLKCNGFHRTQFVWYEMILCRHKVAPIRSQAD